MISFEEKKKLYDNVIAGINVEYCNSLEECWDSNVVRGRTVGLVRKGNKVIIVKYYSHTYSDCPECNPSDIERLDIESLEILDEFEVPSNINEIQLIYNIFYNWLEKNYFNA